MDLQHARSLTFSRQNAPARQWQSHLRSPRPPRALPAGACWSREPCARQPWGPRPPLLSERAGVFRRRGVCAQASKAGRKGIAAGLRWLCPLLDLRSVVNLEITRRNVRILRPTGGPTAHEDAANISGSPPPKNTLSLQIGGSRARASWRRHPPCAPPAAPLAKSCRLQQLAA